MPRNSLTDFITELEKNDEIIQINEKVNPEFEITEITDRISKQEGGGKALLFTNTGTKFPVLTNMMGSEKRICLALGVKKLDEISNEISELFNLIVSKPKGFFSKIAVLPKLIKIASWIPKTRKGKGLCQDIIITSPNINDLPILKCWPKDGGKFITLPLVHTIDPESGIRNVGMYRLQVFEDNLTGMHWHKHKGGASHFEKYKKAGIKMPVSVCIGGDPIYTYAATAPLPENIDEYIFAGFLRKKKVKMVKCITNDLEVPEDVDFVIEGYVDPNEELIWEGPFGDHTGFYSLPDWYPRFHITCITHNKNAVYPATIVGIPPQEDYWYAKATERIFLPLIQNTILPELKDMDLPASGVGHNITLVKIDSKFKGHAQKVMHSLWGAGQMMFNKILFIFNNDVDLTNYQEVIKNIFERVNIENSIYLSRGPLDMLDHSTAIKGFGGKICFDATSEQTIVKKNVSIGKLDEKKLMKIYDSITYINQSYIKQNIPLVLIGLNKNKENIFKEIASQLCLELKKCGIFYIVFTDKYVNEFNDYLKIWVCSNNLNPEKDVYVINLEGDSLLFLDCTTKSKQSDHFFAEWPEIAVSDKVTIENVNNKWQLFGFKNVVSSPSERILKSFTSS